MNKELLKLEKQVNKLVDDNRADISECEKKISELQAEAERIDLLIIQAADMNDADAYAERSMDRQRIGYKIEMYTSRIAELKKTAVDKDEAEELKAAVLASLSEEMKEAEPEAIKLFDALNALARRLFDDAKLGNDILHEVDRDLLHKRDNMTNFDGAHIINNISKALRNPLYSEYLTEQGRVDELSPRSYI